VAAPKKWWGLYVCMYYSICGLCGLSTLEWKSWREEKGEGEECKIYLHFFFLSSSWIGWFLVSEKHHSVLIFFSRLMNEWTRFGDEFVYRLVFWYLSFRNGIWWKVLVLDGGFERWRIFHNRPECCVVGTSGVFAKDPRTAGWNRVSLVCWLFTEFYVQQFSGHATSSIYISLAAVEGVLDSDP